MKPKILLLHVLCISVVLFHFISDWISRSISIRLDLSIKIHQKVQNVRHGLDTNTNIEQTDSQCPCPVRDSTSTNSY